VLGVGDETGTLTVGKRADVVVVEGLEDRAPRVVRTFVGGAPV
jgi:imidazolonepropionase-like amidohydrolase